MKFNKLHENKPTPKNSTEGYTESWKKERERQMKYYQDTPFYGDALSEKFYNSLKQMMPSVIQASLCGGIYRIVSYKKDADLARHILYQMFKKIVKQHECPYTGYITSAIVDFN